jgi:hypothetical protein
VVYPGISVKLRDVPDLGYFSSAIPPQGEICVYSPRLINGYVFVFVFSIDLLVFFLLRFCAILRYMVRQVFLFI